MIMSFALKSKFACRILDITFENFLCNQFLFAYKEVNVSLSKLNVLIFRNLRKYAFQRTTGSWKAYFLYLLATDMIMSVTWMGCGVTKGLRWLSTLAKSSPLKIRFIKCLTHYHIECHFWTHFKNHQFLQDWHFIN